MNNWTTMTEAKERLNLAYKKTELWKRVILGGIVFDAALLVAMWLIPEYIIIGLIVAQVAFYFLVAMKRLVYWENETARMYKILYGDSE